MNYLTLKQQKGIGLIEVLVTTVVISVGLLAVASLQGDFVLSSGDSKTRSEALVLAEKKIESLRNQVIRDDGEGGGYDEITNSVDWVDDDPVTITGKNAVFTRTWLINEGGTSDRKKVSVKVEWDSNGDGTSDADERVIVVTEMVFVDPAKSALYSGASGALGAGAVPSPRQNASEDINAASEDVVGTDLAITDLDTSTAGTAGVDQQLQVTPSGGILVLSQVAAESRFYTAAHSDYPAGIDPGVIAVFLCDDADNNSSTADTCSHIQNHFGGVVHRVRGAVYSTSGQDLSSRFVAWTSSETHACYNGVVTPDTNGADIYEMPYECVYAGNCTDTKDPDDSNDPPSRLATRTASLGTNPVDEGCFVEAVVSDAQINERNVGPGGEYGDMGLIGLDYSGGNDAEQVCFLENTAAEISVLLDADSGNAFNENYLYSVTKRLYVTRRVERNDNSTESDTSDDFNDHKNEGINRSYSNHNFFIALRRTGPQTKKECREQVIDTHTKEIAPREISRVLNEGTDNAVTSESDYASGTGVAHTLIGSVTGSATKLRLFISEVGACYLDDNLEEAGTAATAYACVIGSSAGTADIIGSSNEHKNSDPSVFAVCTRDANTDSACHWLTNYTDTYDDGGTGDGSCSTPWGNSVADEWTTDSAYSLVDGTCTQINLACNSGELEGVVGDVYETASACDAAASAGASCALGLWGTLADGATQEVNTVSSVLFNETCPDPITVSCNDGTLTSSSDTIFQNCTLGAPVSCTTSWGVTVNDGGDITAYAGEEVVSPATCISESQVCTTGVLSPNNYTFGACTVTDATVVECVVPNYDNEKRNDIPSTWNSTGPGPITNSIVGNGNPRASQQSPSAGAIVDCTSIVTVQ